VRNSLLALVCVAGLTGCETGGMGVWNTFTGRRTEVDIPEAAAAAADTETTIGWDRIVVGVRPYHRTVGYLETKAFTPAGSHDVLQIAYIWPEEFGLAPWGFVTAQGGAYRYPVDGGSTPEYMGHMPIETACLHVLGVCPKCGHQLDREVVHNIARVDLDPERSQDFRDYTVASHRASRDLHPTEGTALHHHTGGGVNLDHACEECRTDSVQPLIGSTHSLRVQFEELTAADLAPTQPLAPVPAAPSEEDGGDDSDEG